MNSLFEAVELAPRDPILGLNEQFNADTRSTKVNLGVGVYSDDQGRIPMLESVHQAELARVNAPAARGYLPSDGIASYNQGAHVTGGAHCREKLVQYGSIARGAVHHKK